MKVYGFALGGYSATYYYNDILKDCSYIDFVIKREGEHTILDVCNKLSGKDDIFQTEGIVYKKNEEIIVNPDRKCISELDSLPLSAKDIFEKQNLHLIQISASRGCLNNCSFCYSHSYFDASGKIKWRGRSAKNVVDEVAHINEKYEVDKFYFNNASFEDSLPPKEFAKEFANEIINRGLDISYCVNFRTSFYKICDNGLKDLLIRSGLTGVFLGVESFNEQDLKLYNKHTKVNENVESIRFFRNLDVGIDIGFININPYSTFETLKENEKKLYNTGFLSSLNILSRLRAYKGTPLCNKLESDGLLLPDSYLNYYNYSYVNGDVGHFAKYINEMFSDKHSNIPSNMFYFKMYQDQLVSHLKRIYRMNENALEIIHDFNTVREKVLGDCNEFCHYWYSRLLEIGQNGWDESVADKFIAEQGVHSKLLESSNQIKHEFLKQSKKLLQIDKRALIHLA